MLDMIKEAVASHEQEPGIVGYALIVFVEGGDVCLSAAVSTAEVDAEFTDEVAEAIADVADVLGFDGEGMEVELLQ